MKIVYIGRKEQKADNVTQTPTFPGTRLTWNPGQVHDIADEKVAVKFLQHPMVWQDATGKTPEEIKAMMLPELKAVPPDPRIQVVPKDPSSPYWEPVITVVSEDIFKRVQSKELVQVFMTSADADAFSEWKLERDTRPDPAPRQTGPKKQDKETKAGLDSVKKTA